MNRVQHELWRKVVFRKTLVLITDYVMWGRFGFDYGGGGGGGGGQP